MTATSQRLLIVDDDGLVRENVVLFSERLGFTVTSCATMAKGLEYAATGEYGVMLVDCLLPDGNGMTILEEMSMSHPEVSIIMMTGFPSIEAVIKCLRLGAVDYVIKPFNLFEMKSILERAVQKHTVALRMQTGDGSTPNSITDNSSRTGQKINHFRRQVAEPEFAAAGEKY
jgi:DNA-binding response OmpR family regulator